MTSPKKKVSPEVNATMSLRDRPTILDDAFVEIRQTSDITPVSIAVAGLFLQLNALGKQSDKSTLKLFLGPAEAKQYRLQDRAACADLVALLDRPLDVVVRSAITPDLIKTLLAATGKRYALPGAAFYLGVLTHTTPYDKNKDNQVRRKLFNAYTTDLQTLIMRRTGERNRLKVHDDLLSARAHNALQALAYGTKGLIDAIIIEKGKVITRDLLDSFCRKSRFSKTVYDEFLRDIRNLRKLSSVDQREFAQISIPTSVRLYYSAPKKPQPSKENQKEKEGEKKKDRKAEQKAEPVIFVGEKKLDTIPSIWRPHKDRVPPRVTVHQATEERRGILSQDTIFFCEGFHDKSAEGLGDALLQLDHKKRADRSGGHISIIVNSPGGSIVACRELCSIIKTLKTPVDVIVLGMAASAGSWLLCHATGNRYCTPQSRIMIHEAATKISDQVPHDHFNEMHDQLDQATIEYVSVVSDATGRKFKDVLRDFDYDVWLNAVESLMYGTKGFIDGILVGRGKVLTRSHLEHFFNEKLGSRRKAEQYIAERFVLRQDPRTGMTWKPEIHDEKDFFENPLITLEQASGAYAVPLIEVNAFKKGLSRSGSTIDYFVVGPQKAP